MADGHNDSCILDVIDAKDGLLFLVVLVSTSVLDGNTYVHHRGKFSRKYGPRGTGLANSENQV